MELKRKNIGTPAIIFGLVLFLVTISRMNFDAIRKNDIIILVCLLIVISCGIYVNVKNKKPNSKS
jgi:hypothetical protein